MQGILILSVAFSTFLWVLDGEMRQSAGSWQSAPLFGVLR
jgi:hypothetical protein